MLIVILKLFAGQVTGWTDKAATRCFPFGEHKNYMDHALQIDVTCVFNGHELYTLYSLL